MSTNVAHAISGAGGGIISMLMTYPLKVASSRLKVENHVINKNLFALFTDILNSEGPKGLYSGCKSSMFGIAITNGVFYYCYESLKGALTKGNRNSVTTKQSIVSSSLAGIAVVLATHPIWTIKTKVLVQKRLSPAKKGPTTFQMLFYTLRRDGIFGLYAGSKTAMVLVLNPIIQYAVFENLKSRLYKGNLKLLDYFLLGAFSKLCTSIIMQPYIHMKSRSRSNKTINNTEATVYVKPGMNDGENSYKGVSLNLVQSVLNSAVLFSSKEILFNWIILVLASKKFH